METFGKIITGICLYLIGVFLGGVVLAKFWAWFVMPVFTSMPVLDVRHAIGIQLFVGIFFIGHAKSKEENISLYVYMLSHIATWLLVLLLGWCYTLFL